MQSSPRKHLDIEEALKRELNVVLCLRV